jgi:ribose-phosphate pyrophosphokinase
MYTLLGNSIAPTLRDYFTAKADNGEIDLLSASIGKFPSSEAFSEIAAPIKSLKGKPVTIIQSLAASGKHTANDFVMQLLLTVRNLKKNGAGPIWAVMPFASYMRQDRKFEGRMTSVAIDDLGFLLKQAGAEGVSTIEAHSKAGVKLLEEHFGAGQVFNLDPTGLFSKEIKRIGVKDLVVGGPDAGANERAESVRKALKAKRFSFTKRHVGVNRTEVTGFSGNVRSKNTDTVDDMYDTGGTTINSQLALAEKGAKQRYVMATHGIFSNGGLKRIFEARAQNNLDPAVHKIFVTDSIDIEEKLSELRRQYGYAAVYNKVKLLSVGPMLFDHIQQDIINHPKMKVG